MSLGKDYFVKMFSEEGSPNVEQVTDTPVVEDVVPVVKQETKPAEVVTPVEESTPPSKFVIDGEEITADQIKEWKLGNMRQSDYTRKTQELANERKKLEEAKTLPLGDRVMDESDSSVMARVEQLELANASERLDAEISMLKQKYPDFNEVEILTEAERRGIYNDLEFVYKGLHSAKPESIDTEKIKNEAIEAYKNSITKQLESDTIATGGSIITSASGQPATDYSDMLTSSEKDYCVKRGWTHKEYVDMKDTQYKI